MSLDLNIHAKYKDGYFHPVLFHSLDVGYVAQGLWDRFSSREQQILADGYKCSVSEMRNFIGTYCALHDIGKITPGFVNHLKNKEYSDYVIKNGYSAITYDRYYHTTLGYHILKKYLPDYEIFWRYIAAHHGTFFTRKELNPQSHSDNKTIKESIGDGLWGQQQKEMIDFILCHFGSLDIFRKITINKDLMLLCLCLISASDWIASDTNNFSLTAKSVYGQLTIDNYVSSIRDKVKKAIDNSFHKIVKWESKNYSDLFGSKDKPFIPYLSQEEFASKVDILDEPSLILIKDLTGNGKTEMMFYAAHKLANTIGHRGIKYFLPTQATSNVMWPRQQDFIKKLTDGFADVLDMQLIHSGNRFSTVDVDSKIQITKFLRLHKCKLMSQFSLGTVDQALMGLISVRYFYLRLLGLFNTVIVVDEIHSYDAYTGKIIQELIRSARILGSSIIISTATLSTKTCKELMECYNGKSILIDYPGFAISNDNMIESFNFSIGRKFNVKIETEISCKAKRENVVEETWQKLGEKGQGCIICNKVKHAQSMFLIAKKKGYNVILAHAKFGQKRKSDIIRDIVKRCGKGATINEKLLVVATQIIEQSIDVDFDYIVTYLCPIDFLVQRIGRLWRHIRVRDPLIKEPVIKVIREINVETKHLWEDEAIYKPNTLLSRTWDELSKISELKVPENVQKIVDAVYDVVDVAVEVHKNNQELKINNFITNVAIQGGFLITGTKECDEDEIEFGTRDIEPSISLVPCTYEDKKTIILIDGTKIEDVEPSSIEKIYNAVVTTQDNRAINYFKKCVHSQWSSDATLRGYRFLKLENGQKELNEITVSYDDEIGLMVTEKG